MKTVAAGVVIERVEYDNVREVNDSVTIEYVGTLEALHAAGCIDADTFQVFSTTRKRMVEKYLPHWWISRRRNYSAPGYSWTVCLVYTPVDLAKTLPGVSEFPVVNRVRGYSAESKLPAMLERELASPGGMQRHARPIGRFQRAAEWVTLENLIWVRFPESASSRYLDGKPAA